MNHDSSWFICTCILVKHQTGKKCRFLIDKIISWISCHCMSLAGRQLVAECIMQHPSSLWKISVVRQSEGRTQLARCAHDAGSTLHNQSNRFRPTFLEAALLHAFPCVWNAFAWPLAPTSMCAACWSSVVALVKI